MTSLDAAMAALVGSQPRLGRKPSEVGAVFAWADLNYALDTQRLEWPRLRVVSKGETVPELDYTHEVPRRIGSSYRAISPTKLNPILRSGATLVIDGINQLHPGVDLVAAGLSAHFRAPVLVNLYASWGGVEGFDLHWDDHEVLVLQVDGTKTWQVHEPTRDWPLWFDIADAPRPDGPAFLEHTLTPGDLLYVPHGWWHMAVADKSPSLHLTFGVTRPTGVDYLSWIVDKLRDIDLVRKPLSYGDTASDELDRSSLQELLVRMLESTIQGTCQVSDFLADQDARARPLSRFSLPLGVDGGSEWTKVRWLAPRAGLAADDFVQLTIDGRRMRLPLPTLPTLRHLLAVVECSKADLRTASGLPEHDLDSLVSELASRGLVKLS